ncbi:MAG: hypothetical protein ABR571_07440 [Jatrophihabitans sp.]|uniref:hypothetical protein n=1 Tax=Jatrophihabitans sp. TaxID=1932789 RepID=UPI003912E736
MPIRFLASAAVLGLLAACSSGKPQRVVTVTVPPSSSPRAPSTGSSTAGAGTTTPGPSTSPGRPLTKLSGTCDTLLPDTSIDAVIGGPPLAGVDAFIVGKPEPTIGRLAYLNCRYGVTGSGATAKAKIEIGVSLYSSPEKAASRIATTVDDYTAHGASGRPTTVDGQTATILTGGVGTDYEDPLLVVASGQRTVAVNIDPSAESGAKATDDAASLATLALKGTGG